MRVTRPSVCSVTVGVVEYPLLALTVMDCSRPLATVAVAVASTVGVSVILMLGCTLALLTEYLTQKTSS